jgi:hypothetical protein
MWIGGFAEQGHCNGSKALRDEEGVGCYRYEDEREEDSAEKREEIWPVPENRFHAIWIGRMACVWD